MNIKISSVILAIILLAATAGANDPIQSRTVWVIADLHSAFSSDWPLALYAIQDQSLLFTDELRPTNRNGGPIGLAVDTRTAKLFVTYEDDERVDIINARTAERQGMITLPGTNDLAGVDVLEERGLFYVVDRGQKTIFTFNTGDYSPAGTWILPTGEGAYGIEVVENVGGADVIFVADGTSMVRWYDIDTRQEAGMAQQSGNAISIAVDNSGETPVIYTTAFDPGHDEDFPADHDFLIKYDLATNTEQSRTISPGGRGVSVNEVDQVVYVAVGAADTTWGYKPTIRSYSTDNLVQLGSWPLDFCGTGLLGVCTPTDVVATPLAFGSLITKELTSHPGGRIEQGDEVVFTITITNESLSAIHVLPFEDRYYTPHLAFVSAQPAPDDATDDGAINWSDLCASFGGDLEPDETFTLEVRFTANEIICPDWESGKNDAEMIGAVSVLETNLPDSLASADYLLECTPPVDETDDDDDTETDDDLDVDVPIDEDDGDPGWPEGKVTGGCCGCE